MKRARIGLILSSLFLAILLLTSCPTPGGGHGVGGSLTVTVNNHINVSRTLLPPISMQAASYTVSGSGPGGASFSQSTSNGALTVTGLAFGSWTVTVNALNAAATLIGSGNATTVVHTGQTSQVSITVVPLSGNGSLSLQVSWTGSQVESPSVEASLTPTSGAGMPLSFSVAGNQATYSSSSIPAGYQTLVVQLKDNGIAVMGAVEVVRIVAGQTTSGSYEFTNVNQPGGTIAVNITPMLADPIPVSISGVPSTVGAGTNVVATASVGDGTGNVVYVWYLNGESVGTGASWSSGSGLTAGYYRLDVTAYTADGTRAGSATAALQVTGTAAPAHGHLYVADFASNRVYGFTVGSQGALAPLDANGVAAGIGPRQIAVTSAGFVYVSNTLSNSVSAYSMGSGGILTPLSVSSYATEVEPVGIAATPDGSYLYAANLASSSISAYRIGSDGLLSPLGTPVFSGGSAPYGIVASPNGKFLYVTDNASRQVAAFAIGSDGGLSPLSTPTCPTGADPIDLAITPDGSFLYVSNSGDASISRYAVGADGILTPAGTTALEDGAQPRGIAVAPSGGALYVVHYGTSLVSGYEIGAGGDLTLLGPALACGTHPYALAVSNDGSFLYTSIVGTGTVSAYSIGSNGTLAELTVPTYAGSTPIGFGVAP